MVPRACGGRQSGTQMGDSPGPAPASRGVGSHKHGRPPPSPGPRPLPPVPASGRDTPGGAGPALLATQQSRGLGYSCRDPLPAGSARHPAGPLDDSAVVGAGGPGGDVGGVAAHQQGDELRLLGEPDELFGGSQPQLHVEQGEDLAGQLGVAG